MSCRKQSHLWGQTRLLRDLCSQILKIFNDRFCITSLDSLYQSLSVLMQQNYTSTRFRVFLDWGHCVWHSVFCTNSISFKFFSQGIWLKHTYIITWSPSKRGGDWFLTLKLELLMYKALVPSLGGKKISFSHLNVTARIPLIAGRSIKVSQELEIYIYSMSFHEMEIHLSDFSRSLLQALLLPQSWLHCSGMKSTWSKLRFRHHKMDQSSVQAPWVCLWGKALPTNASWKRTLCCAEAHICLWCLWAKPPFATSWRQITLEMYVCMW